MKIVIQQLQSKTVFTSKLAVARALMAISSLFNLVFNNIDKITDKSLLDLPSGPSIDFSIIKYSIFTICGNHLGQLLSIVIMLFVISGYLPRISILLQTWVSLSICNSFIMVEGGDQIVSNLSLLLIPICLLDPRRNQWIDTSLHVSGKSLMNIGLNVYYFLIRLQVSLVYLHAAIGKLAKDDWLDGTCLYYWVTDNLFGVPDVMSSFYSFFTLSSFAPIFAWSIIMLEFVLFASILSTSKNLKLLILIIGILFHFAILITHGLVTFFFSMCAALILYLDSDNLSIKLLKKTRQNFVAFLKRIQLSFSSGRSADVN